MRAARELLIKFRGDASDLAKAAGQVGRQIDSVGDRAEKSGGKATKGFGGVSGALGAVKGLLGPVTAAFAGFEAVDFAKGAISGASDLGEAGSKIEQIFGQQAASAIDAFASTGAKKLGQTKLAAMEASATFGVFGKSAGLTGTNLAKFSTGFTQLSTDLASFHNSSPEEAVEALSAALRGETEPMRRYGVLLDDASMRQQALKLGLIKTTKEALTPQQKVLAAQALIMEQTKDAQGDFAKTSGGLANQQRILTARFEDNTKKLGQKFLPAVTGVVTFLNEELMPTFEDASRVVEGLFSGDAKDLPEWVKPISTGLDQIKTNAGDLWAGLTMDDKTRKEFDGQLAGLVDLGAKLRGRVDSIDWEKILGGISDWWVKQGQPGIDGIVSAVQGFVDKVYPIVSEIITFVLDKWTELAPKVEEIFGKVGAIAAQLMSLVQVAIEWVGSQISTFWETWGGTILAIVGPIYDVVVGVISGALDVIMGVVNVFIGLFTGDWNTFWNEGVLKVLLGVWDAIVAVLVGALDIVLNLLNEWGVTDALQGVVDWVASSWAGIKEFLTKPIKTAVDAIGGWLGSMQRGFDSTVNAVKTKWGELKDAARIPVNFVIDTVYNNGLRAAFNKLAETLSLGFRLPELPTLARGGVLPGFRPYGAGDDQLAWMRSGEGVTVSEAMRDPYERWRLIEVNRRALSGRSLGDLQGYDGGGIVRPVPGDWTTYAGHRGIDFPQPMGTPVHAWKAGRVNQVLNMHPSWGNYVRLDHGGGIWSAYAHLSRILTSLNAIVGAGQTIGQVGSTGNSTGPHLHWEIWRNGDRVNPAPYLNGAGASAGGGGGFDPIQMVKDALAAPLKLLGQIGDSPIAQIAGALPKWLLDSAIDVAKKAVGLGGDGPLPILDRDRGGWLPTGPSIVRNGTGRGEYVLTPEQVDALLESRNVTVVVAPDHRGFRELIRAEISGAPGPDEGGAPA